MREAVGDKLAVVAKLNMADGVRGGLWLDESVAVGRMLEADGGARRPGAVGGSSLQNPMYFVPGRGAGGRDGPGHATGHPPRARLAGRAFLHEYPFEEAYLLPYARQFRAALDMPLVLLGVNRLDTVQAGLDEGFELAAMARALLREPDLVARWQRGTHESLCVHCNKCMATIYRGRAACSSSEGGYDRTAVRPTPSHRSPVR